MKKIALYGKFTFNMEECLRESCPEGFELYSVQTGEDPALLKDADYIINRGGTVSKETISFMENTKLIHKWGVGYDKIDVASAGEKGIPVTITIGGNAMPVAELAVGLMLDVYRHITSMTIRLKDGEWAREEYSPRSYLLNGKKVGLIGIGNIARKVAHILKEGFGCTVSYYDVFRLSPEQEAAMGVTYAALDDIFRESDIVSIHVPLLDSTRGMVNKEKLELMKSTAILINTARGPIIREADLIEALQNEKILGAGLDTYEEEPLPASSPLLQLDNVVTTPHCGGNTIDNDINMAKISMDIIRRFDETKDRSMREIVNGQYLS